MGAGAGEKSRSVGGMGTMVDSGGQLVLILDAAGVGFGDGGRGEGPPGRPSC